MQQRFQQNAALQKVYCVGITLDLWAKAYNVISRLRFQVHIVFGPTNKFFNLGSGGFSNGTLPNFLKRYEKQTNHPNLA